MLSLETPVAFNASLLPSRLLFLPANGGRHNHNNGGWMTPEHRSARCCSHADSKRPDTYPDTIAILKWQNMACPVPNCLHAARWQVPEEHTMRVCGHVTTTGRHDMFQQNKLRVGIDYVQMPHLEAPIATKTRCRTPSAILTPNKILLKWR